MKRTLFSQTVAVTVLGVALAWAFSSPGAMAQSGPAPIPPQNPIAALNRTFELAWTKPDRPFVESLLAPDFTWITAAGVLLTREEALANWPAPAALSNAGEVSVRIYGRVALLQVHAGRTYVLRIFVDQGKAGFRLLHVVELKQRTPAETAALGRLPATGVLPSETGVDTECINPCQQVPLHAPTLGGRTAVTSWQQMEIGAASRDMNAWGYHVANEAVLVDSAGDGVMTKTQYIADANLQKDARNDSNEAPPMLWGRTYDMGDIVLLLALQQPYQGQPFYASRLFVNREGRYQMVASYYTQIHDAPAYTLSDQVEDP